MNPSEAAATGRPVLDGIRIGAERAGARRAGDVTYTVIEAADKPRHHDEQRTGPRRRTRLRSGKLADARGRFVIECIFYDRSSEGARLRLVENVPLPTPLMVYDDETGTLSEAHLVWRDHQDIGIRFGARPGRAASSLGAKFYAVPRAPSAR